MIPDVHSHPAVWGIRPVFFTVSGYTVNSYTVFVLLGLVAALLVYYLNTRAKSAGGNALYIAIAAATGGIIGAKVPIWVANLPAMLAQGADVEMLLSGRTIVGGIIGGVLAVYLTKRKLHITQRLGNYLVPSLCIGVFFGRIGCFLAGCCYGTATSLSWGVNFGDGVLRHPTQLYEAIFVLGVFVYAQLMKEKYEPGELFRRFMIAYFGWRFLVEFVRVNPVAVVGLTYYQIVSLAVVVAYLFKNVFRNAIGSLGRSPQQ